MSRLTVGRSVCFDVRHPLLRDRYFLRGAHSLTRRLVCSLYLRLTSRVELGPESRGQIKTNEIVITNGQSLSLSWCQTHIWGP